MIKEFAMEARSGHFRFDPNATGVMTTPDEALRLRRGVCQDFGQLQIAWLRSLNLAARYVSGYLRTDSPPGHPRRRYRAGRRPSCASR